MTEFNDVARASVRGGFFLLLGKTSSTILMAISSILVARLLGPEKYGLYAVTFIIPSFLISLSDLGITPALTRFSAHFRAEGRDGKVANLIRAGIAFKLTLVLTISLFLLLLSDEIARQILNRPGIGPLIRIASIYFIGQALLNSISSTFIGLDEAERSSLLMNVQAAVKAVASPLLIILGLGVAGAILGAGVGIVLAAATGAIMLLLHTCPKLRRNDVHGENVDSIQGLKMMISYGTPLYLSALIGGLRAQIQRILLALFTPDISIGNYSTAMNFSTLIIILAFPIATSLFPAFSKLNIERDRGTIQKMFQLSVKYTSLILIPASIALAILSKQMVYTLYGAQYQTAPAYLTLYMLSFLFTGLGMYVIGAIFNSQGETRITFKINLIGITFSISLASILIPTYGVPGLIASSLASQLVSTGYGLHQIRRKYGLRLEWISSLRIIVASVLSALPVYILLKLISLVNPVYNLAIGGTLYITSFLILAPTLGALNKEDIENLESLLKELPLIRLIIKYIFTVEKKILDLNLLPAISSEQRTTLS